MLAFLDSWVWLVALRNMVEFVCILCQYSFICSQNQESVLLQFACCYGQFFDAYQLMQLMIITIQSLSALVSQSVNSSFGFAQSVCPILWSVGTIIGTTVSCILFALHVHSVIIQLCYSLSDSAPTISMRRVL